MTEPLIVYFSTKSENTKRFVEKLGYQNIRITSDISLIETPYVLITPTYGGGYKKGAVPPQVIQMLNISENRSKLVAVVSTGNRNFGNAFCLAGKIISEKCKVPNLADVELFGTKDDVHTVKEKIDTLFGAMNEQQAKSL